MTPVAGARSLEGGAVPDVQCCSPRGVRDLAELSTCAPTTVLVVCTAPQG